MASPVSLRHVSIGQYIPGDSVVHRLDPRSKLAAWLLLLVGVVVASGYVANLALLAAVLAVTLLARLSIGYILGSVRVALPIIAILSAMQLVFYQGGPDARDLVAWGRVTITDAAVRAVIVSLLRFVELLFLTSLLTNTTTTSALSHGIESLLRPASAIGLPGHELAMVGSIALRFVPILGQELESIQQAQASRGVVEPPRTKVKFIAVARRTATLIVPLFVDVFRRAQEMELAMRARCYRGGRGRTHFVQYRLARQDTAALVCGLFVVAAVIVLQVYLP